MDEARTILPAHYAPPARCGDILLYLRAAPAALALVDGLFERTAAVWHKEILYALERGIPVYGASSMGALRAAELDGAGMVGVGEIYRRFADGTYGDDDEVAVAHAEAADGFRVLSDAMANIRSTLEAAPIEVGEPTRAAVIRAAKATFYAERSLVGAIKAARGRADDAELDVLADWVAAGGSVDQKGIDARELLSRLAAGPLVPPSAWVPAPRTVFFRKLARTMNCLPLPDHAWLPAIERQVVATAGGTDLDSRLVRDTAGLLAAASTLGAARGGTPSEDADLGWGGEPADRLADARRLPCDDGWPGVLVDVLHTYGAHDAVPDVVGATPEGLEAVDDPRFTAFRRIAKLWRALDAAATAAGLATPQDRVAGAIRSFCTGRAMVDAPSTAAWLRSASLDDAALERIALRLDRIGWLMENTHALGGDLDPGRVWLHDAVALAGAAPGPRRPSRPRRWLGPDALAAAYRYVQEVVLPDHPDIVGRMADLRADPLAADVAALLLDANEHVFCAATDDSRRRWLATLPLGRVLDFGCGAGFSSLGLALAGHQVAAVDANEVKLDFLRWAAARLGVADRVSVGWVGFFDAVVCINVLDHLPDGSGLVEDFARCLRPGGYLALYAHFTADGRHTSDPRVVDAVVAALDRHFDRPEGQPSSLEIWVRREAEAPRRCWLVPARGAPAVTDAVPRRHAEVTLRQDADGVITAGGPRFWQRRARVSTLAARVLAVADGHRTTADLAAELGVPTDVVVPAAAALWRARFLTLERAVERGP
ncbi:MAG: TfuA-like protein [Acidimicrobiales bacterium]